MIYQILMQNFYAAKLSFLIEITNLMLKINNNLTFLSL